MVFPSRTPLRSRQWNADFCKNTDAQQWYEQVARKERPGFPKDGRYFVAFVVERKGTLCLVFERAATRSETQQLLKEFELHFRRPAKRESEFAFDDLDGVWVIRRFGKSASHLIVVHPDFSDRAVRGIGLSSTMAAMGLKGSAAALDDPDAYFAKNWRIAARSQRERVATARYGELIGAALELADPIEDPSPTELDELQIAAQRVADHQPIGSELQDVDAFVLRFLQARLAQAKAKGMSTAATFRSRDRRQIHALSNAVDIADSEADRRLLEMQEAFMNLCKLHKGIFAELGIQNRLLLWLFTDDLLEQVLDHWQAPSSSNFGSRDSADS